MAVTYDYLQYVLGQLAGLDVCEPQNHCGAD
jgi:hypothetical protein